MKFKTFKVSSFCDTSWTGGRVEHNENHTEEMDQLINSYAQDNNLTVINVSYNYVNERIQHGPHEQNSTRLVHFIAAVTFN